MHEELTRQVIGAAMRVHGTLGPGFLESVYQRALVHELRKIGLEAESEKRLRVWYDGVVVGDFEADLLIESVLLIELKAVQVLNAAHAAQVVNYLSATGLDLALLFNFGSDRLEYKRKYRTYLPSTPPTL